MFQLLAFYTNDLANGSTNVALGTVTDQVFPQQNSRYQAPERFKVIAAYGGIPNPTDMRVNTPSLRLISLPYTDPVSPTALPADNPPVVMLGDDGPEVQGQEEVTVEVSRAGAAVADTYAALWLRPRFVPAPAGPIITVKWTAAVTIAEGVWTAGVITLTQTLPAGRYAIIGMSAYGTNLLFSRVIFANGGYRPGVLSQGAVGEFVLDQMRFGRVGTYGQFVSYAQPMMEFFGVGAGTAQTGFWDLVKIG